MLWKLKDIVKRVIKGADDELVKDFEPKDAMEGEEEREAVRDLFVAKSLLGFRTYLVRQFKIRKKIKRSPR